MHKNLFNRFSIVIFIVILIVAGKVAQAWLARGNSGIPEFIGLFLFLSAVPLVIGVIVYTSIKNTMCPSCEYVLTREETSTEAVSERKGYETVTREMRDKEGNVTGQWQDQVRFKKIEFEHNYKCSHCGHEWKGISVKKYDTFED